MNKLSFFIFLFSFFLNLSQAQLPDIEFEHFTSREGLAGDLVLDIEQDNDGFLWFATEAGLSRFDGYSFSNYLGIKSESDSTYIPSSAITAICKDQKGMFWISSYGDGVGLFNPANGQSQKIDYFQGDSSTYHNFQVNRIVADSSGYIWIATNGGLHRYDPESATSTHFVHDPDDNSSLSGNSVRALFIDHKGILWIGTGNWFSWENEPEGLNRYDPSTQKFKRYNLFNNNVNYIGEDHKGDLLVGSEPCVLYSYDLKNDRFLDLQLKELNSESNLTSVIRPFQLINTIWDINFDQKGNMWVGKSVNGLTLIDSTLTKFRHIKHNSESEHSLSSNSIGQIFQDNQGNTWIATTTGGVNKVVPSRQRFNQLMNKASVLKIIGSKQVRSFLEDRAGNLWTGLENGDLYRFQGSTVKRWNIPKKFNGDQEPLNVIYKDSKNRMWIGGQGYGLIQFSHENGTVKRFIGPEENGKLSFWNVTSITEDGHGNMWLGGSYNGADLFNPETEAVVNYQNDTQNSRSLSSHGVLALLTDSDGTIWLGTYNGLNRYREETNDFDCFLPDAEIRKIIEDKNGDLWIGTRHHGLINFNRHTEEYKVYTTADGLPNNYTNNIIEDKNSNIWIGSPAGLTRFNPESRSFVSFGKDDGIDNLFTLDVNSGIKLQSGEIILSGTKGITSFSPEQILINKYAPNVVITDLKSYKNSLKENGILDSTVAVNYDQNDLTFEYIGLHYTNPLRNSYAVKLEPYERDWQYVGTLRQARYTNLSPGAYTFKVKAANSDGVWNEKGKQLSFIINPPIWATWWAYIFYILLVFGLLYSVRKFELNRRQEKEESRRKTKELEEARQLQLSMLPKELPQLPNLDIAVYMQTATEVGGDYYDFHVSMDGTLTVVIGDATGHGMKAGTMVTTAKSLFKSYGSNSDILFSFQEFSRCIKEMNFGRIAMCLTMVKINDHTLRIATAGMPPSYIYRSKTKQVEEYQFEAMPLGAMDKFPYELKESQLNKGDTVLLISDGLPELENKNNEMFGYSRIKDGFERIAEKSPDDIISFLKNEGASWADNGDPDDDVTFVVIKVK